MTEDTAIAAEIIRLTGERGPDRSICPSEVARAMAADWRPQLTAVRRVAVDLSDAGRIDILRHGRPVTGEAVRGVIRLRAKGPA